jgi:hypothetical protein
MDSSKTTNKRKTYKLWLKIKYTTIDLFKKSCR